MIWRWLKRAVLALSVLILVVLAVLYGWSEWLMTRSHEVQGRQVLLSSRPEVIARGQRLARVFGCFEGCHGREMQGQVFFDEPIIARVVAPSLGAAMSRYSTAELEGIVRQGVRPDGRSVLGMPSASFSIMTDRDLVAVLSFIRDYAPEDAQPGKSRVGPLGRLGIVRGLYLPEADKPFRAPAKAADLDNPQARGEYLAITVCSECHGLELGGQEGFTPSLDVANAYSAEAFADLMSTGKGLGGRDLGLMSEVARNRFKHLEPAEVQSLHAFLLAR